MPNQPVGTGGSPGMATLTGLALEHTVTDAAIRCILQHETAAAGTRSLPEPRRDLLYFVYLPARVTVVQGGAYSYRAFSKYPCRLPSSANSFA